MMHLSRRSVRALSPYSMRGSLMDEGMHCPFVTIHYSTKLAGCKEHTSATLLANSFPTPPPANEFLFQPITFC